MRHALAKRILEAPTADIGVWPTPIDTVTTGVRGPEVLVKRDDLSGHGRGGAKARKLDCLVGHLVRQGHDELVAVAGNVTNLAFDLLPALDRHGIHASLFIIDDPVVEPEGREVIFEGVRDRVCLLGASRARAFGAMMTAWARGRRAGRRPFVALPGVSHPTGVLGNARGFMEMVMQQRARSERVPETVYVTAATGTTLAGFLLGEHALRSLGHPAIRIVGVQIYPGAIRHWTRALLRWTERSLGIHEIVPEGRVEVAHDELDGGFARYSEELVDLCARVESETRLRIDPIFGGKTWAVMERRLARDRPRGATMYWHCGYTPEWEALGRAVTTARAA